MWSFLAVICRSQSLVFEEKKRNFFGLLPNTESNSLENALSFLNGDILEKLSFESGLFWWSFLSEQFRLQLNFCWLPVKGRLCTESAIHQPSEALYFYFVVLVWVIILVFNDIYSTVLNLRWARACAETWFSILVNPLNGLGCAIRYITGPITFVRAVFKTTRSLTTVL